jgi:hypothetical protein
MHWQKSQAAYLQLHYYKKLALFIIQTYPSLSNVWYTLDDAKRGKKDSQTYIQTFCKG